MERQKCLALKKNKGNYEGKIFINKIIIEELQWWLPKISISTGKIKIHDYDFEIYSDASKTGWGIYCKICKGEKTHSFWSAKQLPHHINYLELLAVFLGLKCFAQYNTNSKYC